MHAARMAAKADLDKALFDMTNAAIDGRDGAEFRAAVDAALDRIDQIDARPLAAW
ncbi:MAG: hypothetical protein BWX70_02732 [Verrucomicrobia bacterium ADurb.Bin070]|nr:MAG: hypothetical protein BWX70_02732 [Verrucomicrobia bacterium ADurb.Bin070]